MQKTLGKMCVVGAMITPAHAFATDITGTILDSQSQPIPGAVVEIINTQYSAVADADGKFSLSNLPEGPVELHITAPNFIHQSIDLTVLADEQSFDVALQPSSLEVIDVYATPFHASVIESSLPVTVLAGDALRLAQTSTLGETLNSQVGVHSTYFGGVASSPIIRGLDGPRVLVTQNGLDASDASRVGADHVVAAETATAQQIEVLRGPATLFYGSGAIGGVVNVVDQRIPTTAERQGRFLASTSTVNSGKHLSGAGQFAINENVVLYADGVWRDADEYEADKVIEETQSDTTAFTLGASYLLENGFVGLSYERTDRQNGLPGHAHGHEEDDEHVEDHDEGHDEHDEEAHDVYSDLQQDRVQLLSDVYFENQLFSKVSTKLAYTDYTHAEIEEGEVGTRFNNETLEAKMTFLHQPINGWKGGLSVHAKHTDFAAVGEEAFTPASKTEMFGLALMEEKHIGDVLVQFGARVESVSITADGVEYDPEIFTAGHVDESHEDVLVAEEQHDHDHSDHVVIYNIERHFTPVSVSLGAVWEFTDGYNLGLSASRSQRAASAAELLANGLHIGTGNYEIGAMYELHEHDGETELALIENFSELETSNNLDLTLRKFSGDIGFVFNLFYNKVDNYYYENDLGFTIDAGHDHSVEDEHEMGLDDDHDELVDEHDDTHGDEDHVLEEEGSPVFLFMPQDVELYGFEAQVKYQVNANLHVQAQADYIRGKLQDGGDLARIPPKRLSTRISYSGDTWDTALSVKHTFKQDKITSFETATDAFTMVDVSANWYLSQGNLDYTVYGKVENLTDELAYVHQSFLKEITPLPGRNFVIGVRGQF